MRVSASTLEVRVEIYTFLDHTSTSLLWRWYFIEFYSFSTVAVSLFVWAGSSEIRLCNCAISRWCCELVLRLLPDITECGWLSYVWMLFFYLCFFVRFVSTDVLWEFRSCFVIIRQFHLSYLNNSHSRLLNWIFWEEVFPSCRPTCMNVADL